MWQSADRLAGLSKHTTERDQREDHLGASIDHGDDHGDDKDAALTSDAGVCSMTKTIMSFVVAAGAAVVIY